MSGQTVDIVNVLGTEYTIEVKAYDEVPDFKARNICGYCDALRHMIVLCDMRTWPKDDGVDWETEPEEVRELDRKHTLRHEIVHAFFNESGLQESSASFNGPWARFEELVDWIAIQGPKIYKAWQEVDAV